MTSQRANQLSEKFYTRRSLVNSKRIKKGANYTFFSKEKAKMIKIKVKDREISLPKNSKYLLPGNRSNFFDFFRLSVISKISITDIFDQFQFHHFQFHTISNRFSLNFQFLNISKFRVGVFGFFSGFWFWTVGNFFFERQKKMDIISSQRSWDYDSLIFTIYHLTHLMNLVMHFFKVGCKFCREIVNCFHEIVPKIRLNSEKFQNFHF